MRPPESRRRRPAPLIAILLFALLAAGCSRPRPRTAARNLPAPQDPLQIPDTPEGALIFEGKVIFDHTPDHARPWAGNALSCSDCHLRSGTQYFAAPMYGAARDYPSFSGRAGRVISLEERIQECFVRSENGRPPSPNSEVERSLVAYIDWLSRDALKDRAASGRGYGSASPLTGDPVRGKALYASKCAGCHGLTGVPNPPTLAPLWGPQSWNDGAGMNLPSVLASFLLRNMPADKPGSLKQQEAADVAAFVDSRSRPKFNRDYARY